jgi:Zn-dependent M28 family amino/carboxypeptidase
MRRTVRLALWTGAEQGLLGSRAYVAQHLADPAVMMLKPEHSLISAYFNLDGGSGAIRGIHLQGNELAAPMFDEWVAAFRDQGVTTISASSIRDSDHRSFDAVGIPAFHFMQEPFDFERIRHTSADTFDRLRRSDLTTNAAAVASLVYSIANRDERLPRKPLPKPDPSAAGPWSPGR